MTLFNSTIDAARWWLKQSYWPVPVPYREKKPLLEEWPKLRLSEPDLPKYFNGRSNIAVLLGDQGEADVDLDCSEALAAWPEFAPETRLIFGRQSKPASHYFYRVDPAIPSVKYIDPVDQNKITLIELRCLKKDGTVGFQTVVPPSVHESGEDIRFDADGVVANVEADVLSEAVARTAAAALLARHFPPPKGGRNDAFLAIAGTLARAGWIAAETIAFHRAIYRCLWHDPNFATARSEVESTYRRYADGHQIYAFTKLQELIDRSVLDKFLDWLNIRQSQGPRQQWGQRDEDGRHQARAEAADSWPKPEPLLGELPPVLPFSEDFLPDSFRPLIADVSERMQVPLDFPAVGMVLCLAGVVNRRATIQPKAHDAGWVIVPNLWGGIVAPPGFLKSPVLKSATAPLYLIERFWREQYAGEVEEYQIQREAAELRLATWKEQTKASFKKDIAPPLRPDTSLRPPTQKRLIIGDATFEKQHELMSENPAGLLVVRDELSGWMAQLDRPGREGERAFNLECWNGDVGHTIDRIGRGSIYVPACCLSMFGGITPGRLRSYLTDALEDGPSNDGLIQRFQVLVWPNTAPDWTYIDRAPDAASEQRAASVFRRLAELDPENATRFRFACDAQELFIEWLVELEAKIRGSELHPALTSHLSKYRKLMPALAVLFELADAAAGSSTGETVSLKQAQRAAASCEYLESHAKRVYSCILTPQLRAARELAEKIGQRKVGAAGSFTCRDVYWKGWSGLNSPEAVKQAAEVLEDAAWVRRLPGESGPAGGRPADRYAVNPRVQG